MEFKVDTALKAPPAEVSSTATPAAASAPREQAETKRPVNQQDSLLGRRRFASLSTFVQGECNQLAFTAAQSLLAQPGAVSPLVLYGPPGSGKTHLLEGIWSQVRRSQSTRRVIYLTAEQFTSYFLEALRGGGLPKFRHKYRDIDVLLIDDIQFFAGKKATVMELQQTLDTMQREGKQVVLTSDRRPSEISGLSKELKVRLEAGLLCDLRPVDGPTRLEVTRRLAAQRSITVPEDCLQLIARRIAGDVRRISGALNRLQAASAAYNEPISQRLAERCLADLWGSTPSAIELDTIERVVSEHCGVPAESLCSKQRTKPIAQSRMLAMFLARKLTRAAYKDIGAYFGDRRHSTVISAQNTVIGWLESGASLELASGSYQARDLIERLEEKLKTG
jgi:chromosomal replication initiator protein